MQTRKNLATKAAVFAFSSFLVSFVAETNTLIAPCVDIGIKTEMITLYLQASLNST